MHSVRADNVFRIAFVPDLQIDHVVATQRATSSNRRSQTRQVLAQWLRGSLMLRLGRACLLSTSFPTSRAGATSGRDCGLPTMLFGTSCATVEAGPFTNDETTKIETQATCVQKIKSGKPEWIRGSRTATLTRSSRAPGTPGSGSLISKRLARIGDGIGGSLSQHLNALGKVAGVSSNTCNGCLAGTHC